MKLIIVLSIIMMGCNNFIILENGAYRPRKPQYDFVRFVSNFNPNPLIDTNHLYVSIKKNQFSYKPFSSKQKDSIVAYFGFFGDGRFIRGRVNKQIGDIELSSENAFTSADQVGYYISHENLLQVEYFGHTSDGSGQYLKGNGLIKKDTIIFWFTQADGIFKYDTAIVSNISLKKY
jgi:hypothetical protein